MSDGQRAERSEPQPEKFALRPAHRLNGQIPHQLSLLESIFRSITDGVIVADTKGNFVFSNDAAEHILGRPVIAVPQSEWSTTYGCYLPDQTTLYPPEDLPLARSLRGERVDEVELFMRNADDGPGKWITVSSSPLFDEQQLLLGGVVIFRDITRRRRALEIVRRLSKAVERTADCVFITDARGRIQYVNPAFEQVTGYSRKEALGQTPRILKSGAHDADYYRKLWETVLAGEVHTGTVINRKKNGERFDAEQTITPIKDSSGNLTHFVSVVRDVTEIKKAEQRGVAMRLAREVQQRLYPSRPPGVAGFDIAGAAYPADETCGDYFDFIPMWGDSLGIAVGDVSGHGFSSALIMAETRAYLRSVLRTTPDLCSTLDQLNSFLCADTADGRFVTLQLVCLVPRRRWFSYASAGHTRGYVIDGSGAVKHVLDSTARPLGLFPEYGCQARQRLKMDPGDTLFLMTDGVTEVEDEEENLFGDERAIEVVANCRELPAQRIVERLREAAAGFAVEGPQLDDITIVVCKCETSS
jgi:PAS domain S-box-containing protein